MAPVIGEGDKTKSWCADKIMRACHHRQSRSHTLKSQEERFSKHLGKGKFYRSGEK
jgi:hypothetical protein